MAKKLTPAQAAKQYIEADAEEKAAAARKAAAKTRMLEWFDANPLHRTYEDKLAIVEGSQLRLDSERVKAELGDRLPQFQKRITYRSLSIL